MVNFVSKNVESQPALIYTSLSELSKQIREKGIHFREIELDFRKKSKKLVARFRGGRSLQLSSSFFDKVDEQLEALEMQVLNKMRKKMECTFVMTIKVDTNGNFSFDNIDLTLKVDCGHGKTAYQVFNAPFHTFLPFAGYIGELSIRGRDYQVTVMQANVYASLEELEDIVNFPIKMERVESQWMTIVPKILKDVRTESIYDIELPCFDGTIVWDNKVTTLQYVIGG